jgi:heat shock protein HspQ
MKTIYRKEAMDKEETVPFYHVLIHRDDFQYVVSTSNNYTFWSFDEHN